MKRSSFILFLIPVFLTSGCSSTLKQGAINQKSVINQKSDIKIAEHPAPYNFGRGSLKSLPSYDPGSEQSSEIDLRGYDLSSLELKDRMNDLMYADFDSKTTWPESMPDSFNPEKIMELGKNPGLGVNKLHKQGITGKGVSIAIIDQALLVDHEEYKDNLKMYEEIHCNDEQAAMHGPAVASIAVGKTVGVAPAADLYYIGEAHGDSNNGTFNYDFTWLAKSIDRILEVNKSLSKDKKIRVISISAGWTESLKGYNEVMAAVMRAKEQGIFVVSSSLYRTYGYNLDGLGRNPLKNPDETSSYEPGLFWASQYYGNHGQINKTLLIPMDSRTTASSTGNNDYVFYRTGGISWVIPYTAGLYALACQVKHDITPDVFWAKALSTGDTIKVKNNGNEYELKKIVNPERLIESIKNNK